MTHAVTPLLSTIVPFDPATSQLSVVAPASEPATPTISAAEMSRLTGVERERLRTWERRHGFPVPVRSANNVRRYRSDDVRRVAAIARASAQGVPLAQAVTQVLSAPRQPEASVAPGLALDSLQSPAIAIRGPRPLEVVWRNGAADTAPACPMVGDDLCVDHTLLGAGAMEILRRLMAGESEGPQCFEARDWTSETEHACMVTAWLIDTPDGSPTAVIARLPQDPAVMPVVTRSADVDAGVSRLAQAASEARQVLRRHGGLAGLQHALAAAATSLGASDAALALVRGQELRVARSVRGGIAPRALPLIDADELRASVKDGQIEWLGLRSAAALRIDPRARTVAVPMTVGDCSVGVALFVLRDERPWCPVSEQLLLGLGASLGAALERERSMRLSANAA